MGAKIQWHSCGEIAAKLVRQGHNKIQDTIYGGRVKSIKWLIFEEEFLKRFIMQRSEDISKQDIYIVNEVLTPKERREKWEKKQKDRWKKRKK